METDRYTTGYFYFILNSTPNVEVSKVLNVFHVFIYPLIISSNVVLVTDLVTVIHGFQDEIQYYDPRP